MEEPLTFFTLIRQCLLWDSTRTRPPRDLTGGVLRGVSAAPLALPAPAGEGRAAGRTGSEDEQEPRPP